MLIADACTKFMTYSKQIGRLSENTVDAYRIDLREFQKFCCATLSIENVTPELLNAYVSYLLTFRRLAPATAKRRFACLKVFFNWLLRRGDVQQSPFARVDIRIRVPERLARSLRAEELTRMLRSDRACMATRLAVMLLVATGMRIGELTALRIQDVDLIGRSVRIIGKGNRERRVFLPNDNIARELRNYIRLHRAGQPAEAPIFVKASGAKMTTDGFRSRIAKFAKEAGLSRRVTPHMFRHSTATLLIESGVDIRFVQRLLGHQSISTTQLYTHVSDPALQHAIANAPKFQALLASGKVTAPLPRPTR